jgi:hypothetical protein
MPSGQPAITGEGFNWGYFIGAVGSGGSSGDGPNFPVLSGAGANHLFDLETPWIFQDYYFNMISVVLTYTVYPGGTPPPYNFKFRLDGAFISPPGIVPPIDTYVQGLLGRAVTFNEGSTLTIDSTAFTTGQTSTYTDLYNPPTYVQSYSGMHLVS